MIRTKILLTFLTVAVCQGSWIAEAQAGPLLDWIRGRRSARTCTPTCPTPTATCQTTCQQTCSRVVVNYVPCTAYRTCWERIPVTQFRQTTTTDPCTGCTVTCQKPCTTYTWRMKQVPYTTYRPVYRRETYTVPVTYTTQMPASPCNSCTTGVGGCATGNCSTGVVGTPVAVQAPAGTIVTGNTSPYYQAPTQGNSVVQPGTTGAPTPADTQPSLDPQNLQRPKLESPSSSNWTPPSLQQSNYPIGTGVTPTPDPAPASRWQDNAAPQLLNPLNKTTQAPSVQKWNYSPVRLASYKTPVQSNSIQTNSREYVGNVQPVTPPPTRQQKPTQQQQQVNQGWRSGSR